MKSLGKNLHSDFSRFGVEFSSFLGEGEAKATREWGRGGRGIAGEESHILAGHARKLCLSGYPPATRRHAPQVLE